MICATDTARIRVAQNPLQWLNTGIVFTAIPCAGLWGMFNEGFSNISGFVWWFLAPIMCIIVAGLGLFLSLGVGMLLYCVEHIELSKEEIRLKLGPITIKKLPTTQILTVGYSEQGFGKSNPEMIPLLFLSALPVDELVSIGDKELRRARNIEKNLSNGLSYEKKCIYAACNRFPIPWFMLGLRAGFVMGYSSDRLETIKQYIMSAKYFVE